MQNPKRPGRWQLKHRTACVIGAVDVAAGSVEVTGFIHDQTSDRFRSFCIMRVKLVQNFEVPAALRGSELKDRSFVRITPSCNSVEIASLVKDNTCERTSRVVPVREG